MRGLEGMPLEIGDIMLPDTARLSLVRSDVNLTALEFVDLVNIPQGNGMLFSVTMQVESTINLNFMEGCFHYYDTTRTEFPGMIISTGMEDYFVSAYYFDGGEFRSPIAGNTHLESAGAMKWSGYRFHEMDPIVFSNGMRFQWRNGDVSDPVTGLKCTQVDGKPVGNPQPSHVVAYAWVYQW